MVPASLTGWRVAGLPVSQAAMERPKSAHVSVMSDEIIQWLSPSPGQTFVDGTLGGGGHTRLIAESVGDQGQVISFDRDPAAIDRAVAHLQGLPVKVVHADFREIPEVLDQLSLPPVNKELPAKFLPAPELVLQEEQLEVVLKKIIF